MDDLIQQAQSLLDSLWDIHRRMGPDVEEWEAYNDYHREQIEGLIGKAERRLERRTRRATTETECDICYWHTPCRDDGEAYTCIDTEACALYQRINAITHDRNVLTEQRDALLYACEMAEAWLRGLAFPFERSVAILAVLQGAIAKTKDSHVPRS